MIRTVDDYLAELKAELAGTDRSTIQDALSDAEEYLRTALSNLPSKEGMPEAEALASVIEKYGLPAEVAAAYRQIESRTRPGLAAQEHAGSPAVLTPPRTGSRGTRPLYARFFGVFAEPAAWGALIYLLFAMATGIIYFTWAVTGLSVSFGLLVLIVGLPVAGLFLLSVRGIALVEGRLVETLLGVRMPRRPRFSGKTGLWQRFKNLIADKHTWFSLAYMLLQMPLGIIYFTLLVTLVSVALGLVFWPIVSLALGVPVFVASASEYFATPWLIPISIVAGALLMTIVMHLAKALGKVHGLWAKAMLVRP